MEGVIVVIVSEKEEVGDGRCHCGDRKGKEVVGDDGKCDGGDSK